MALITITIPDAVVPRVLDAVALRWGWTEESGLTKTQFAKSVIIGILKETVKMQESNVAAQQAIAAVHDEVDTEVVIT